MLRTAITYILLQGLVILQAYLAHQDGMLTVAEMRRRGIEQGLPFLWHFGMWGDAVIISALVAIVVGEYSHQWRASQIVTALALAVVTTGLLGWLFSTSHTPESHVLGHRTTVAGIVHLIYMALALTCLLLFFVWTHNASARLEWAAVALVTVHLLLGTHMALGVFSKFVYLEWYPDKPLQSVAGWAMIVAVSYGLFFTVLLRASSRGASVESDNHARLPALVQELTEEVESLPRNRRRYRLQVYQRFRERYRSSQSERTGGDAPGEGDVVEQAIEQVEVNSPQGGPLERAGEALRDALGTVENRLRLLDSACNLLTGVTLLKIFLSKYDILSHFPDGVWRVAAWRHFLADHGVATCLLLVMTGVYYLSRRSVKTELPMARELFSNSRVPRKLIGAGKVEVMVIFFTALFLFMAWQADDVRIVAGCLTLIFCNNFVNQLLTRVNLKTYFSDPGLRPAPTDEHYDFIVRRRRLACDYFFHYPHLLKECLALMSCLAATLMAMFGHARNSEPLMLGAFAVLVVGIAGNELIAFRWRMARHRKWKAIDEEQYLADEVRIQQLCKS